VISSARKERNLKEPDGPVALIPPSRQFDDDGRCFDNSEPRRRTDIVLAADLQPLPLSNGTEAIVCELVGDHSLPEPASQESTRSLGRVRKSMKEASKW